MDEKKQATEAVIIDGTHIEGKISGDADVRVEGKISGEVEVSSTLYISPEGTSEANIKAKSVMIEGTHSGNVDASESVQITPKGKVKADITAPEISIEKGARFSGRIEMYEEE